MNPPDANLSPFYPAPRYARCTAGSLLRSAALPLPSAIVTAKKGALVAGTAYSAADGSYTIGNLKPGAYTLTVTRSGYTFSVPAASATVGPSSAGNDITALTGLLVAPKQLTKDRGKPHHGRGTTTSDPAVGPAP